MLKKILYQFARRKRSNFVVSKDDKKFVNSLRDNPELKNYSKSPFFKASANISKNFRN